MKTTRIGSTLALLGSALLIAAVVTPAYSATPTPSALAASPGTLKVEDCTQCHDDSTLISGKHYQWATSAHATGTAFLRGTSADCAGCHSGGGFMQRILAGLNPDQVAEGDPNPTPQDCRTCHQIHVSYTSDDWRLETTDPVNLYAIDGNPQFDKGAGNLCVNCHQPRRDVPRVSDLNEMVTGISTHWGPHHGPQSAMMLGVGGAIGLGSTPPAPQPHRHYLTTDGPLKDGCVSCHMGPNANHSYQPDRAVCSQCHNMDAYDGFDYHGVQTLTKARLDAIGAELVRLGVLSENSEDGHPTVTSAVARVALPLYNWLYVAHEDKSLGVHNPDYTAELLTRSCYALGISCP